MDTRVVRAVLLIPAVACVLAEACVCAGQGPSWAEAATKAARFSPQARILVLDIASGRVLASRHLAEAGVTLAAPGSTLKPLVLYGLVESGRWDPARRIACDRRLRVAGHALNCGHPPEGPMDASEAIAWSCNTYFASVAGALRPGELRALLEPSGLLSAPAFAPAEVRAVYRNPRTAEETKLTALGIEGIEVTPLELAAAYRWLALELAGHPQTAAARAVREGLEDATSFGSATAAALGGVPVEGKTGTASAAGGQSHGWFVGLAPEDAPSAVVVVYLPAGRGTDASRVAAEVLKYAPLQHGQP